MTVYSLYMTHTGHKVDVAEDQHCDAEESDDVYIVVDELHRWWGIFNFDMTNCLSLEYLLNNSNERLHVLIYEKY